MRTSSPPALPRPPFPLRFAAPLLVLAACAVGPDYEEPEHELPDAWKTAIGAELSGEATPLETWWLAFEDPQLVDLITRAAQANLELEAAAARVAEARAGVGIATGRFYGDAVVSGSITRQKASENGIFGPLGGGGSTFNLYDLGVGYSWEIDVFGRLRRNLEAAGAVYEQSVEDYRDVLVILLADVAANYVNARALQARLDYARSNARTQRDTLALTQDRFDAGLTSARDVAQAESNLANTEASIPVLEVALEQTFNRLSVLLGEEPGAVDDELAEARPIPDPEANLATGMPADLLRRRPDIRAAERQVAAQTALIGVAEADLYPTFTLDGLLGLQSVKSGQLFDSDSRRWQLIPGLQWNIFSGGRIQSQVRAQEAVTQQALLFYEQTVLLALEEVENAMIAYELEKVRRDRLLEAVDASQRAVELVRTQYMSGLTDFQSYLDSERALFVQQDELAESEGQVVINLIALSRALGGGWVPSDEEDQRTADANVEARDTDQP